MDLWCYFRLALTILLHATIQPIHPNPSPASHTKKSIPKQNKLEKKKNISQNIQRELATINLTFPSILPMPSSILPWQQAAMQ